MRAKDYAKAFVQLHASQNIDEKTLLKNFVATVHANGHRALLPKIVRHVAKMSSQKEKSETVVVTSPSAMDENAVAHLLRQVPYRDILDTKHKTVVRKTDESLIGGHIVRSASRMIDTSYKRMLINLYEQIIH